MIRFDLVILSLCLFALAGCAGGGQDELAACRKTEPDSTLLRQETLKAFIAGCGLEYYPDATGKVTLHYQPPRHNGTIPVSAPRAFSVSEAGGALGRVWYLCMPVPMIDARSGRQDSLEAVCRYAGSGPQRVSLTYDAQDAVIFDPRNW